jgi:hypothetical protein
MLVQGRPVTILSTIPACPDADWHPVTVSQDPEQNLALIFTQLGRDYGDTLPADFVPLAARAGRYR